MEFLTDTKVCTKCLEVKSIKEFYPHKNRKDGLQSRCKTCHNESVKQWKAKNPGSGKIYARNARRKRLGIHGDTFDVLLIKQQGKCAICGGDPNGRGSLHEDHDYKTGQTRGLLCSKCNTGLGMFNDSEARINQALQYLQLHRAKIDEGI